MPYPNQRMSVPPLAGLEGQGHGSLGGGGSPVWVPYTFSASSSTVQGTHPHGFLFPNFHQGDRSGGGFYSRMFVVWKTSGSWRPVIYLSVFNRFVFKTPFKMETIQLVVLSVRQGDWMVSIDLKEAYLQVSIHPDSRKYLRFVAFGKPYQFRALCFGLSTAPQDFTRVMTPISTILHSLGIRMRRYLDDWLIQASSRKAVLQALSTVLSLCRELGVVVNPEKLNFVPAQRVQYLGMVFDAQTFRAFPSQERIDKLMSLRDEFLSSRLQPTSAWLTLLGTLSALSHLVPGDHFRMRALQLALHCSWDRLDDSFLVSWSDDCLQDLRWWMDPERLLRGMSISALTRPRLLVRRVRCRLGCSPRSRGRFRPLVSGRDFSFHKCERVVSYSTVAVFADNTMAVAYLRNSGDTRSLALNFIAQCIIRWSELHHVRLAPQFIMGSHNVLADSLSLTRTRSKGQSGLSAWKSFWSSVNDRPVCYLSKSPLLHLFLALPRSSGNGDGRSPTVLGPPPGLRVPSLGYDSTDPPQAQIIIRSCADSDCPVLASKALVSGSAGPSNRPASNIASSTRSPQPASLSSSSSLSPQASSSCLATLQRFTWAAGFSSRVAAQVGLAWRSSSRTSYQLKWSVYRQWCRSMGPSVSRPSLPKVADFLLWLRRSRKLSVSSVMGYRSVLVTVFHFKLPNMSSDPVLQ